MDKRQRDLPGDLKEYATEIALMRVEAFERHMRLSPEQYPDFVLYRADIERERVALIEKLGGDAFALDPFMQAHMSYQMELLSEVYVQAALDGGRVCRAFLERELPRKETKHDV